MRRIALATGAALTLASIVGCGGPKKPADLPELFPCSITIIQDGQPLEGASVQLNDPSSSSRFVVGGTTDEKGVAVIRTDGQYPGAPVGKYKVLVSKIYVPELPSEAPPEDPEARKEYDKKVQEMNAQQADTVDLKFKRPTQTPAEIEVTTAGAELTVDVGEKVNISAGAGGNH